jgi:hypothetical protein
MNVAAAGQFIEVTGTTTTVDTASSTAGTTLNSTQVSNLPINGRDVSNFLEIAPGSVGSAGFFQGSVNGLENIFTGLNVTVDGQNASRGDINGFLDTEGGEAARVTRASVDSIQEINFANNGYSAENGRSLGPQMNIITKSGSNAYHGTLFEFLRNDALDANDYFENSPTVRKLPLRLNQFGGNFSGPVVRNKLFFFLNYEGVRQRITSINALNHTLSAHARSLFVPAMQPVLAQMAPLPAGCTGDPAPVSCLYNGDPDFVLQPAALPTTLREDTGSIRLDYNVSDNDQVKQKRLNNQPNAGPESRAGCASSTENAIGEDRRDPYLHSNTAQRIQRVDKSLLFRHKFEYSTASGGLCRIFHRLRITPRTEYIQPDHSLHSF